jgi:bidirectional [NiFe] hydrogenase diaphorase subunit
MIPPLFAFREFQYDAITKASSASTDDKRWKLVQSTMRRHGYQPNALIETLHSVQESSLS